MRLDAAVFGEDFQQRPPANSSVLDRVTDEGNFQVEALRQLKQFHRVFMPEHRGFIDDGLPIFCPRLEPFVEQEPRDRIHLEAILRQHPHRVGGGSQPGDRAIRQPHAFVVFLEQFCLARPCRPNEQRHAIFRTQHPGKRVPLAVIECFAVCELAREPFGHAGRCDAAAPTHRLTDDVILFAL